MERSPFWLHLGSIWLLGAPALLPCTVGLLGGYEIIITRLWGSGRDWRRKVGEGVGWVQFAVFLGNRRGTDELIHLWNLSFHWLVSGLFISPVPWKPSTDHSEPRVGKTPWRRKWQPLQYSCPGNPMDRGAWRATARGATELDMTEQPALSLSFFLNSNFIKIKDKGHL